MVDQKKVKSHFKKVDPIIYAVMEKMDLGEWFDRPKRDYFIALCREIIGQQLSGKVANVIFTRFEGLFPKRQITPERILTLTDQQIRDVGTSWAKVRSLKDLATQVKNKNILLDQLDNLSDEATMKGLMKVKGVGPWTAEMFLIFTLKREDVFSLGDLGLNKAINKLYGKRKIGSIIKRWSPYKSFGCLALWHSLDNV